MRGEITNRQREARASCHSCEHPACRAGPDFERSRTVPRRSRAGSAPGMVVCREISEFLERCPSGLRSTPGKCVCVKNAPRVRIPPSPPVLTQRGSSGPFMLRLSVGGFEPSVVHKPGSTTRRSRVERRSVATAAPQGRGPQARVIPPSPPFGE